MEERQKKETIKDIISTCKKALQFTFRVEPKLLTVYVLVISISAVTIYLQLNSFAKIVDEVVFIQGNNLGITRNLIKHSLLLGGLFLIPAMLNNIETFYSSSLRNKTNNHLQLHRMKKFSELDIATIESTEFQNKVDFANRWGTGSIMNVLFGVTRSFRDVVALTTSGVILFSINPLLVLFAVVGGIPGYFTAKKYQVKLFRAHNEQTEETRILEDRRSFFTQYKKIIEVLLFDLKSKFTNQVRDAYSKHTTEIINISRERGWAEFFEELFNTVCLLGAVAFIIFQALQGNLLVGALVLAFTTYRAFVNTTNNFFYSLSQIEEHSRYAFRWFELFELRPKIISKENALQPLWEKPPMIHFENISFTYSGATSPSLKNITLTISAGEKIAFVGLNGAGKTTLVKLIARVYDPTEGVITIDGIDLKEIDIGHWRNYLGILFQDFADFRMTAREAIAISRPNDPIDDAKVEWAAEVSGAIDFIKDFPKKYDQLIWKGFQDGVELSRGQHQRMAVARIFYRDALISILDEPTSAIDAVAEEKIFESLEQKMQGKTVILISHRFSTVKNADQIAVIEHGELKELGSHRVLMQKNGRYAELYTMQADRYKDEE